MRLPSVNPLAGLSHTLSNCCRSRDLVGFLMGDNKITLMAHKSHTLSLPLPAHTYEFTADLSTLKVVIGDEERRDVPGQWSLEGTAVLSREGIHEGEFHASCFTTQMLATLLFHENGGEQLETHNLPRPDVDLLAVRNVPTSELPLAGDTALLLGRLCSAATIGDLVDTSLGQLWMATETAKNQRSSGWEYEPRERSVEFNQIEEVRHILSLYDVGFRRSDDDPLFFHAPWMRKSYPSEYLHTFPPHVRELFSSGPATIGQVAQLFEDGILMYLSSVSPLTAHMTYELLRQMGYPTPTTPATPYPDYNEYFT